MSLSWPGAANEADVWLMKINQASRGMNFEGTFVYVHENTIEAMRVIHKAAGGVMRERLYSLNGAAREIIRDEGQVWCYVPEKKIGVHEYRRVTDQSFPHLLEVQLSQLEKSYIMTLGRVGRIADRAAQQILITPRDRFRYGYELWADADVGLLLKATLLDADNTPIEQYMFTAVKIGEEIADASLEPMTAKENLIWYQSSNDNRDASYSELKIPSWQVNKVPQGFMLTGQIKRKSPMRKKMMEHYVYSDGLAAVSIFIEKIGDDTAPRVDGLSRMGAVHAFGHTADGYQITVVGEVPADTVDMMGMSVTRLVE